MGSRDQGLTVLMSLGLFASPSPLAALKSPTQHCSDRFLEHFGTCFFPEKPNSPSSSLSSFIPPAFCCGACSLFPPSIPHRARPHTARGSRAEAGLSLGGRRPRRATRLRWRREGLGSGIGPGNRIGNGTVRAPP